jgi:Tol biopolymer transport system component
VRRTLALAGIVSALGLVVSAPPAATATPTLVNGRILYVDFNDCNLYSINPDGTGKLQLTDFQFPHCADWPSTSRDGSTILFTDLGGHQRLWAMNADRTGLHQVAKDAPGFGDYMGRYSPDGSKIAFARCQVGEGDCAIWAVNADGTDLHALTAYGTGNVDLFPSWSPDGTHIAFSSFGRGGVTSAVYVMKADGSDKRRLTPPATEAGSPAYSPFGLRILVMTNAQTLNQHIGVMDADGSNSRALTYPPFPHNDVYPQYSPDGKKVVFASDRNYPDGCCLDLFVMNADGTGAALVPTGQTGVVFPWWAPVVVSTGGSR